jgi:RNA polymerase nonessential primary-like sigma factor
MALKPKEAPEFDVDDEMLLIEPGIVLNDVSNEKAETPITRTKVKQSGSKQL